MVGHAEWATVVAAGILAACGGSSVIEPGGGGVGGSGGAGASAGTAGTGGTTTVPPACGLGTLGAQPPPPAANADPPVSGKVALVVSELLLGDRDWGGTPSPSAWKQYGYNLDGVISTRDSTDLCQPAAGAASTKVYPDGDAGIDNSFGKNLLPIFMGLAPDLSLELNNQILMGGDTVLVDVAGLGAGPSYTELYATSWRSADLASPPALDGSDMWPPVEGSDATLSCGYATDHTVVLSEGTPVEIPFAFGGIPWVLVVHQPIVTMELAPDHRTITRGVIAGVLHTEALIEGFRDIAGQFDTGLCTGSTFDSIADQFRQASDIMQDGGQNPAQVCDAMSLGIGFRGTLVSLGAPEAPPPPPPDPCL
jgi:hypothetical protein